MIGQCGRNRSPANGMPPPRFRAPKPGLEYVSLKTGTPTAAIFLIENTNALSGMETHKFQGISTVSKSLNEFEQQAKATFELGNDKWTYATKMTEYEAFMELYSNEIQI